MLHEPRRTETEPEHPEHTWELIFCFASSERLTHHFRKIRENFAKIILQADAERT